MQQPCPLYGHKIFFVFKLMLAIFERHIDGHGECKFVLASESGKFNEERMGGHLLASYQYGIGVGLLLILSSKVFQNQLAKIGFGTTLSAFFTILITLLSGAGRTKNILLCTN